MSSNSHHVTLLLAAGRSTRMGTDKSLLPFGDRSALDLLMDTHRRAGIHRFLLVVGTDSVLRSRAVEQGVQLVVNPTATSDMLGSVVLGLQHLPSCHVVIQPVDVPLVTSRTLEHLLATPGDCVVPRHGQQPGHPPLLRAPIHPIVEAWPGSGGLHGCLTAHREHVRHLEVDDPAIHWDMDHPADYQRLLAHFRRTSPDPSC